MLVSFLVAVWTAGAQDPVASYPRPGLILEASVLAKPDVAKRFRILDARPKVKYEAGHIPGAVWVDVETLGKIFAKSQDPKEWAPRIGQLGIGNQTAVVIYDDAMSKDAARIWWILRYWGVGEARLLNGGWKGWTEAGYKVTKDLPAVAVAKFVIKAPREDTLATKEQVLASLKDKKFQIIDTRSQDEFCGIDKKAKRGGAIPGAMHLEWTEALDKKTHRFKSSTELLKLFKEHGLDLTRPSVTYCQSGGRAAVMAFTLELMGAPESRNYYRSWSEWGNADDTPIVLPKAK